MRVGQHTGISSVIKRSSRIRLVGQHAGIVGQHKQEWWVNMRRNLQTSDVAIVEID